MPDDLHACSCGPHSLFCSRGPFIDKIPTGFVVWSSSLKGYTPVDQATSPFVWQKECQPTLKAISNVLGAEYYSKLSSLWSQESNKSKQSTQLRPENIAFIKTIGKYNFSIPVYV